MLEGRNRNRIPIVPFGETDNSGFMKNSTYFSLDFTLKK